MDILERLARQKPHLDAEAMADTIGALSVQRVLAANFSLAIAGLEAGREHTSRQSGNSLSAGIKLMQELSPAGDLIDESDIPGGVAKLAYVRPGGLRRLGRITAAATMETVLTHYAMYAADLFEDDLRGLHKPTQLTERIGDREMKGLHAMAADLSDTEATEAGQVWVGRLTSRGVAEKVEPGIASAEELPAWVSEGDLERLEALGEPYDTNLSATEQFNVGLRQMLKTADMAIAGAK